MPEFVLVPGVEGDRFAEFVFQFVVDCEIGHAIDIVEVRGRKRIIHASTARIRLRPVGLGKCE
jgi:hypothetical protein